MKDHFITVSAISEYHEDKEGFVGGTNANFSKYFGLKKIGVHYFKIPPGLRTSRPHAESIEEEFVYIIQGEMDLWLNGKCIGESAPYVFFYEEVSGNIEHKISTESEFSPNDLIVKAENGKNYFVSQYIKMGVFVGGAGVELVNEEKGKKEISELEMAIKGQCSS